MSSNKFYRILAWIGVATAASFGIVVAVYYGTQNTVLIPVAGLCAASTIIIWIFLYFARKRLENSEEMSKLLNPELQEGNEADESEQSNEGAETEQPDQTEKTQAEQPDQTDQVEEQRDTTKQ